MERVKVKGLRFFLRGFDDEFIRSETLKRFKTFGEVISIEEVEEMLF